MTTKRGPLSQDEKDFIASKSTKGAEYIAKKLNRNQDSIQKFLDAQAEEAQAKEPVPETMASEAFARNKKYGAVVMTETASMISDESRKARVQKGKSPASSRYKSSIHIIKPK
jgi:hypothetical protein